MTKSMLEVLITTLIGSIITIGAFSVPAEDIIKNATAAANGANLHQIATVLELYYDDHGRYPSVEGGEALIDELTLEGYLKTRPLDASIFRYTPLQNAQEYSVALIQQE